MDPAAPRPSGYVITAETAGLHLEPLPPGYRPSELVLRLALTETHEWFGIGGGSGRLRRPRRLSRGSTISLSPANSGGPDYLRSAADCRRLIVRATADALRGEGDHLRRVSPADWDEAVPPGVEVRIAESARAMPGGGGGACRCEVSIRVRVEFVYSEAAALLWACTEAAGDGLAARRRASGPCSICLEKMAAPDAAEATCLPLPGCAHGFHSRCIGGWFDKASTCPVCRRDKLRYLPPDYRAARDMILSDPEGSC